jgi:hypothetical protein
MCAHRQQGVDDKPISNKHNKNFENVSSLAKYFNQIKVLKHINGSS